LLLCLSCYFCHFNKLSNAGVGFVCFLPRHREMSRTQNSKSNPPTCETIKIAKPEQIHSILQNKLQRN
jgi:hypothetical protein